MSRVSCRSSAEKAIATFAPGTRWASHRKRFSVPHPRSWTSYGTTSGGCVVRGRRAKKSPPRAGSDRSRPSRRRRESSSSNRAITTHSVAGMLTLAEPRVAATRRRPDRVGMASEDSESLGLLAFPETEPGESKEHGGASARIRIELPDTGNFIFARSRRARRVQPEEYRRRPAEVREVRLRQGLLRPTRPRKLSDPRLRLPEV